MRCLLVEDQFVGNAHENFSWISITRIFRRAVIEWELGEHFLNDGTVKPER